MANTFTLIASSTVGSTAVSSITFSSIPQTYTDLLVKISMRNDTGTSYNNVYVSFNGTPSGTSYSDKSIYTIGTSSGSLGHSSANQLWLAASPSTGNTSNTFSNGEFYVPNYTGSSNKSISSDSVTEANSAGNGVIYNNLMSGLWANTSAITSIVLTSDASSFMQYSSAYLYGIKNS